MLLIKRPLQWALYSKDKMPTLVDIDKVFDHIMVQRIGETNPLVSTDLNMNVMKFNKA